MIRSLQLRYCETFRKEQRAVEIDFLMDGFTDVLSAIMVGVLPDISVGVLVDVNLNVFVGAIIVEFVMSSPSAGFIC